MKVEQLDWSKLKPPTPVKTFVCVLGTPAPKQGRKHQRVKPKDKRIFREAYEQRQHLRDIMREDF